MKNLFRNSPTPDNRLGFIQTIQGKQKKVCEDIPDNRDFNHQNQNAGFAFRTGNFPVPAA
jgi:hypothetical protein